MAGPPDESRGMRRYFAAAALMILTLLAAAVAYGPTARRIPLTGPAAVKGNCLSCHDNPNDAKASDPGMVEQWRRSVHFARGVGCVDCHGTDHEAMIRTKGKVSAGTCGTCHPGPVKQFQNQGHALAAVMAESNAKFMAQSTEMQRQGCMLCHDIGRRSPDGSVGGCNYCHLGHSFSAAEAREPEACITCHVGPDHPQNEAYEESKHGVAYRSTGDSRRAPTCATCHMPDGNHDVTFGITLGGVALGGTLEGEGSRLPLKPISRQEFERKRSEMVQVCSRCHATSFARDALLDADAIKRQTDALVERAVGAVREVGEAGALEVRPEDRPPNPVEGPVLVMNGHMLYENTSPLEARLFELVFFHGPTTWKGAYHHSPDHTHWLGNMKVKESLIHIETEAGRLLGRSGRSQVHSPAAPAPFSTTFIPPASLGVPFKSGARYLGSRYCEGCHADTYRSWRKTQMAGTFNSLYPGADRESKTHGLGIDPDADFTRDVGCFPCHTTGFGQPGGFVSLDTTPDKLGVQCESCHGPGGDYMDHMKARPGGQGGGKSEGLVLADVRVCVQCHHPSEPCPDRAYVFDFAAMKARGLHEMHRR